MTIAPWLGMAPRIDFGAIFREAEDVDAKPVLRYGIYRLRLERVDVCAGRFLAPRWRVLVGRHAGTVVETRPWRDDHLARVLRQFGITEDEVKHVGTLDGLVPLLEGRVADVHLLDGTRNEVFSIEPVSSFT